MKTLKTLLAACALVLVSFGSTAVADSSNFAGPYIAIQGSTAGVGVEGTQSGGADNVNENTTINAGITAVVAGGEIGYAVPLGDSLLLDIGASYIDGAASLETESTDLAAVDDVKIVVSDFLTYYIAPTLVLSDTSSLYFKYAQTEAQTAVVGDVNNPGDLQGETLAIGTRTVLESGIFIRTEAGLTDYDNVTSQGKGTTGGIATTTKYAADPKIAYGAVSLGFRF
tara:strand:- start:53 stop:730 length:678 start_codon:yes stop_codon:yes gene_type:complete